MGASGGRLVDPASIASLIPDIHEAAVKRSADNYFAFRYRLARRTTALTMACWLVLKKFSINLDSLRWRKNIMNFNRYLGALLATIVLIATGVNALAADASCPGGYSTQFRLNGQVKNPDRFRLIDLQYRSSAHVTVSYFSEARGWLPRLTSACRSSIC